MAPLRAAVVGAGLMGRWHAEYARRAGATVVAVVDPDLALARALAARHPGAQAAGDCAEALRGGSIDVVHLCTPTDTHFALARDALAGGAHVIVEKPAAATASEAASLVMAARERGRVLVPVHQMPFQRGFQRLRAARPELGDVVAVEYRMCSAGGDGRPPTERRTILLEILPHPHSLLRALLGGGYSPEALEVMTATADDLVLTGRAGGVRVAVTMSLRGRPPRNELHVTGTRGSAMTDLFHGYCVIDTGRATRTAKAMRPLVHGARVLAAASANLVRRAVGREPAYPGLLPLIVATYAAARGEGPPPIAPAEILGSVALIERVRALEPAVAAETA